MALTGSNENHSEYVITSPNNLKLKFQSNNANHGRGFRVQYKHIETLLFDVEKDDSVDIGMAIVIYLACMVFIAL